MFLFHGMIQILTPNIAGLRGHQAQLVEDKPPFHLDVVKLQIRATKNLIISLQAVILTTLNFILVTST